MDISQKLKFLVDCCEMTQRQISEALKCSQPTVSEMLRGKLGKERPSFRMVESVEKLYSSKLRAMKRAESNKPESSHKTA